MAKEGKTGDVRFKRKRSRILYEITGLIVVVLVISGLVTFFLVRNSQNELIDKSIDKVIETESNNITSALSYMIETEAESGIAVMGMENFDVTQFLQDIAEKKLGEGQKEANEILKGMVDTGFFDLEYFFLIVPPSALSSEPFVMLSSDESMVYNWEIPDYLAEAMEAGEPYLLLDDGVPELDLDGAQLMVIRKQEAALSEGFYYSYVCVIPMQERIEAINAYYDDERSSVSLTLALSVFLSILAVVIITFFVLNYLIRRRITEPIDQLAADAEEVMEGNLDVEVEVHEGGEFQNLERAFREMVQSIRKFILRSTGEE